MLKRNVKEERKPDEIPIVEVFLHGKRVGKIAATSEGLCAFEYDSDYLRTGLSVSPYFLPLRSDLFIAKPRPFGGGFGVFDDSLPDGWGSLLLAGFFREKGINPQQLTLLQRLSLIGSTGRGALEYYPDKSIASDNDFLNFDKLAAESEKILTNNHTEESLDVLYQYGGSSGGARPKVFVETDRKHWLVKFKSSADPGNIGKIEYDYSLLAKECGINMPETRLFEGKYFGTERFDRKPNGKIHTISAAGLLHADYRIPSLDYSTLLKICLNLTGNMEQVYALFRLMVFNITISNRDDHAKNFSFQLIDNDWKLSPAYDLLPSDGFNGYHTTTINGKGAPDIGDVTAVALEVGLSKHRACDIVDEIITKCNERKMLKYRLKI